METGKPTSQRPQTRSQTIRHLRLMKRSAQPRTAQTQETAQATDHTVLEESRHAALLQEEHQSEMNLIDRVIKKALKIIAFGEICV